MVGWHRRLDGHEFEQAPGVGDGQENLMCCSPWGCKESETTERLNVTEKPHNRHASRSHESIYQANSLGLCLSFAAISLVLSSASLVL